jgi:hypothetical protein
VLREGGTFVYLGIHPCFGFVRREEGAPLVLRPGYAKAGWRRDATDRTSSKPSARVGINHLPLADLVNAIVHGFALTDAEEPGDADPPLFLAFRATKRSRGRP